MRFIGKWYLFFWKLLHQFKKMMFISVDLWHKNEGFFFIELWRKNVIFPTHWDDRWSQLRLGLPLWAGQFFYEKFNRLFGLQALRPTEVAVIAPSRWTPACPLVPPLCPRPSLSLTPTKSTRPRPSLETPSSAMFQDYVSFFYCHILIVIILSFC